MKDVEKPGGRLNAEMATACGCRWAERTHTDGFAVTRGTDAVPEFRCRGVALTGVDSVAEVVPVTRPIA